MKNFIVFIIVFLTIFGCGTTTQTAKKEFTIKDRDESNELQKEFYTSWVKVKDFDDYEMTYAAFRFEYEEIDEKDNWFVSVQYSGHDWLSLRDITFLLDHKTVTLSEKYKRSITKDNYKNTTLKYEKHYFKMKKELFQDLLNTKVGLRIVLKGRTKQEIDRYMYKSEIYEITEFKNHVEEEMRYYRSNRVIEIDD